MAYRPREIGNGLEYKDIYRPQHLIQIWKQVSKFLDEEVQSVSVEDYKATQYLKLIKLKIVKYLMKFKSMLYRDNVKALGYLHKITYLASIFAEYVYYADKKGINLPRKDLNV